MGGKSLKVKENVKIPGRVRSTVCDASSDEAKEMIARINEGMRKGEYVRPLLDAYHRKFKVREFVNDNVVPTVALTLLAQAITGNISALADLIANYSAIGTGTNTPAVGDTQLQTETYRRLYASRSFTSTIAYLTAFYNTTDTSGTFKEHAFFINATGVANSGTLATRVLLNPTSGVAKSITETLTVEHEITYGA